MFGGIRVRGLAMMVLALLRMARVWIEAREMQTEAMRRSLHLRE
jgi:hypothetical protein